MIADTRPGFYDEHHRVRHQLDETFGIAFKDWPKQSYHDLGGRLAGVEAVGPYPVEAVNAEVARRDAEGNPLELSRRVGKGRILYFAMKLGSLWDQQAMVSIQT